MNIFITGSTRGIGLETARQLADAGHRVFLHARDDARAAAALAALPGAAGVAVGALDSIAQTTLLAETASAHGPFDVVIHNAGIGGGLAQRQESQDGLELIFHSNVVAPYLLTALMPTPARLVYLTSGLEADGTWEPDDLQWERRAWNGMKAYSDSKLHDLMLAFEIASRRPGAIVNGVDPGWIKTQMGGPQAPDPVELGAETQVWLATSDAPEATATGRYVKRRQVLEPNPAVRDADARAALVAALESLTGVRLP